MATLYLVSTPIGNLSDLTARAAEVLGSVRRVLAEDTRRTRVLLNHIGVHPTTVSLHAHNEAERISRVLAWLDAGEDLALVSDAGTPLVSDPGARLVAAVDGAGHAVVPVPGPSAVLAALVASGLPTDRFAFLGFVPRKGRERGALLDRVAESEETTILFESPERLVRLLADLEERCGGGRRVAVAREVTKLHEEFVRGTLEEVRRRYGASSPRGEVTVVVEAAPRDREAAREAAENRARDEARRLLAGGARPSEAARELARALDLPRNVTYRIVQDVAAEDGGRA